MKEQGVLTISGFAKLSRTTPDTIRYYDEIGLLSPVYRGKNNYRFYSHDQLSIVNVIKTLQTLGFSLDKIKKLKDLRTPERALELFGQQLKIIDTEIQTWQNARKLLLLLQETIKSGMNVDENAFELKKLPMQLITLGDENDYSGGKNDFETLLEFHFQVHKKYPALNQNYSVWGRYSKQRILNGDWKWPDRFYFINPEGTEQRPAGLYLIGYTRGGYGQASNLYERMTNYIYKNNLEICGDAYEEYPLNEVCISDSNNYLIRVLIQVVKQLAIN